MPPAGSPDADRIETGACFCGRIAATFTGQPFWICYDHDDDCRRAIGGPLTVWVGYRAGQVRLTAAEPRTFSRTPGVTRSFCADCGTSIFYEDEGLAGEIYVAIGFLDHPERFPPQAHTYWELRLPWVRFGDGLETLDGYSRSRDPRAGDPKDRRGGGESRG